MRWTHGGEKRGHGGVATRKEKVKIEVIISEVDGWKVGMCLC